MTSEAEIAASIRLAIGSRPDTRCWQNATGALFDRNGRLVRYGHIGAPDILGLRTITILPEHVGREFAIFVGIEVKTAKGRPSPEQQAFLAMLQKRSALAGIARSVDDALKIITAA